MKRKPVVILGAAGRDFHNFNMLYKDDPGYEVVAFTATQIPFIEKRVYPPELSGPLYPKGIPIYPEERLPELIKSHRPQEIIFSYSDVSHEYVMHRASLAVSLDVDFVLIGAEKTMLRSKRPVISVCAVRTGCGKSGVTRFVARVLKDHGKKPVALRHPMPYGDLLKERIQRFSTRKDMVEANCTIEEMEEYEQLIDEGVTVFAGVDYKEILSRAEDEGDIIIWDGGNNDLPFLKPGLELVVADPLRPGHELAYYPGEANLRRAHCVIINKANSATAEAMETVRNNVRATNAEAKIIMTASVINVEGEIRGKKVLVIEDGPTLTHGGMDYGAGIVAARTNGAEAVSVRPHAVGTIKATLQKYPKLKNLLPAMGYSKEQIHELEETVNRTPADLVLAATPVDLAGIININKPIVRARYEIKDTGSPGLTEVVTAFLKRVH